MLANNLENGRANLCGHRYCLLSTCGTNPLGQSGPLMPTRTALLYLSPWQVFDENVCTYASVL